MTAHSDSTARIISSTTRRTQVAVATLMFAAFAGSWWALRSAAPDANLPRRIAQRPTNGSVEPADRTRLSDHAPPDETQDGVDSGGAPRPPARPAHPPGKRPRTGAVP